MPGKKDKNLSECVNMCCALDGTCCGCCQGLRWRRLKSCDEFTLTEGSAMAFLRISITAAAARARNRAGTKKDQGEKK